jgi:hypothetical protein
MQRVPRLQKFKHLPILRAYITSNDLTFPITRLPDELQICVLEMMLIAPQTITNPDIAETYDSINPIILSWRKHLRPNICELNFDKEPLVVRAA